MTRAEELTLNWLDGVITPEETRELAALLEADESVCEACLRLVSCEMALRRTHEPVDLSERTVQSIVRLSAEATAREVMQRIDELPPPAWQTGAPQDCEGPHAVRASAGASRRISMWALAACVATLLAVGWWQVGWWQWGGSHREGPACLHADSGRAQDAVRVTRAGKAFSVNGDSAIREGDRIELDTGLATLAELRLDGGRTTIQLRPGARLQVVALDGQKRLVLERGVALASVSRQPTEQPMLIQTPFAQAEVMGTVFALAAYEDQTGLTVERGLVRLTQPDDSVVDVAAGESAVAVAGAPATKVESAAAGEPVPQKKLDRWVKGPVDWSADGGVAFPFDASPEQWVLCDGAQVLRDGELSPASGGALELSYSDVRPSPYRAVGPMFPVQPGQTLDLTAEVSSENGARLQMCHYLYEADGSSIRFPDGKRHGAFRRLKIDPPGGETGFVPLQVRFTIPNEPNLAFIALILYCHHADLTLPREGDVVVVRNLRVQRQPNSRQTNPQP